MDDYRAVEFLHKNALFLDVRMLAHFACRVEFGSTNAVGVSSTHYRALAGYFADFCHKIAVPICYHELLHMPIDIAFWVLVLAFSVILHEVAHGYMANWLGDPTAKLAGRLTLNPLKHIDPLGTIILPLFLTISGSSILIGYAKPVPYNPYNLRGKYGEALVAGAGPATNILLALLFGLSIRFLGSSLDASLLGAFTAITSINIFLAIFNLIPIPPLDGSKVFPILLPDVLARGYNSIRDSLDRLGVFSGTLLLLVIFYFLSPVFSEIVRFLFVTLTGAGM